MLKQINFFSIQVEHKKKKNLFSGPLNIHDVELNEIEVDVHQS
jgi:hypothetical protein